MTKAQEAVQLAIRMANDPAHGYDQGSRWGPDFDCSSFAIYVWEQVGVKLKSAGASYTGNVRGPALRLGFVDVTAKVNLHTGSGLQPGDLLVNYSQHMAMYTGSGQLVHASINELGSAAGGRPGDQTGREFLIRSYRNYPWDCVLRYAPEGETAVPEPPSAPDTSPEKGSDCTAVIPVVRRGDAGAAAAACQAALRYRGFDPVWIDGEAGERTESAIRAFQKSRGLTADGVCGLETWTALLEG